MSKVIDWKKQQENAIEASAPRILVSASAGTGKTTVLTERLIRKLKESDPDKRLDIGKMIVVTFTKAAADELRNRIYTELSEALSNDPGNRALSRQLVSLSHAKISTIHSFCLDLIRKHFEDLGLDPNVRVIDEDEKALFTNEIMKNILEDYYDNSPELKADEKIDDFPSFIDRFVDVKDDNFSEELLNLYDKLRGLPNGLSLILKTAEQYEKAADCDFLETPWGLYLKDKLNTALVTAKKVCADSICRLNAFNDPAATEKDVKTLIGDFESDAEVIDALLSAIGSYPALFDKIAVNPPHNGDKKTGKLFCDACRIEDSCEGIVEFKRARDKYRNPIKKIREIWFLFSEDELKALASDFASLSRNLYKMLLRIDRVITQEKKKRGILDFGDIETYAFALLEKEGKPTPTAEEISKNYSEICIDEYQDVNEIQDRIFTAISGSTERFMVGDIKQSIYAFRGASPSLFSGYRQNDDVKKVYLQDNFRCSPAIIRFVNSVCSSMFDTAAARFRYEKDDDLVVGSDETPEGVKPEILLLTGTEDRINSITNESEYIAGTIERMIREEGRKPSDFVILLRSCKHAFFYETSLNNRGIPVYSQLSHEFFENPEILMMLCILNVIDNPTNDVYLSGILRSPLFGFTLNDLLNVRAESGGGNLYDALISYCSSHPDFTKGSRFLEKLEEYKTIASSMPVDRLIWKLYTDNDILSLIFADKKASADDITARRANLMLLYENARKFESDSFRGLYPFIRYLAQMLESKAGEKLESAQPFGEGMNTVKIMSIHKSKGLEFPVVFLARANSGFSNEDTRHLIAFNRNIGVSFKPTDSTDSVRLTTPFLLGVNAAADSECVAEEMRVLYVALTRAKERLFVSAIYKTEKERDQILSLYSGNAYVTREEKNIAYTDAPSYIKWILLSLKGDPECADIRIINENDIAGPIGLFGEDNDETETDIPLTEDENKLKERFREIFSFRYPYAESTKIPAKLSVSDLCPDILDETENDGTRKLVPFGKNGVTVKRPLFLQNESERPEANAAERGTATHVFMQFCSFEEIERSGVDAELKRLTEKRFMPVSMAALVDTNAVTAFLSSNLYQEMKSACEIHRETRFNVRLPAGDFTADPDKRKSLENDTVLVQGVIDCYFINGNGDVILVDYKTDKVPKDRKKAEALLRERHTEQLTYYKRALEKILRKKVTKTLVYSFGLGDTVEI